MKRKLLKSMLLAVAMLCVGVGNVWGVTNNTTVTGLVGATDNSSGFNVVGSKVMSLAAGDEYVFTFVNYNKGASGTNYWANWALISNVFNCRADHGDSNPWWGSATNVNYTGSSWTDISSTINEWLQAYDGVTVTLTVSRDAAGTGITVSHSATTNAVSAIPSQTYAGTFTATVGAAEAINFYLTVENAHLNITKVVYTDALGNTTYSYNALESAYVDSSNGATNYNGASVENLQINNTQYRDWASGSDGSVKFNSGGKVSLYKFDLTEIKGFSNITTIVFSVVGISSDTKATSPVRLLGYNPEWVASTITYNSGFTNNGNKEELTGTVSGKGSFQPLNDTDGYTINGSGSGYTTINANAKTYVESAIAADKSYVSFGLAVNLGRVAYLNVGADLTISCSASIVYTATFTEANSLSPAVTIYSDSGRTSEVSNGSLEDGTTYYYRAVLEGYYNYEGSFTVDGANPDVEFTMTAKPVYNYSVNAIDGGSGIIKANIVSGSCYADETTSFYLPTCVLVDGTLYFMTAEDSYKSVTVTSNNQVFSYAYTASAVENVVFFVEGENITGAATSTATNNQRLASNGYMGRGSSLTVTTLPAGSYTVYVHYINTNSGQHTVVVNAGVTDIINNTTINARPTINGSVTLTESTAITLTAPGSSTSGVDYLYIVKTAEPLTITSAGWATLYTPYALDFSGVAGLTAYTASLDESTVTLTPVNDVPANTGVVLQGNAGTYDIPVITSSSTAQGSLTGNAAASTAYNAFDGYTLYVLKLVNEGKSVQFNPVTSGTIAAGKAFLKVTSSSSSVKAFNVVFGDATAIDSLSPSLSRVSEGTIFNLAGQRVSKLQKGVNIVNGKKLIIK